MPGGRVPSRLLITSRCGGWFEPNERETPAQRGYYHCGLGGWGEQRRLHTRRRHPNAFCYSLFSFLPIFQARTHPRGQRRRFLKAFSPLFFFFFPSPGTEMLRGLWASTVLAGSQNAASAWAPRPGLTLARSESLSPFLESQLSLLVVIFSQCNSLLPNFSVLVPKRKRSLTHLSR